MKGIKLHSAWCDVYVQADVRACTTARHGALASAFLSAPNNIVSQIFRVRPNPIQRYKSDFWYKDQRISSALESSATNLPNSKIQD